MKHNIFSILFLLVVVFLPQFSNAQGLSMSVTPTLFEMSAAPLQAWQSTVKVINNNQTTLTVYANVVNFAPQGETGQGKFLPVFEDFSEGKTLAEWITVPKEAFVIPPESSIQIPISVNIPEDASPGGHFAAIMVGTRPPERLRKQQVSTSQIVTSLFFVRVAGDVVEKGDVRTFTAGDSFVDTPEVTFEVRFENKGNVHLLPQGQIVITNMWGKERGTVPINYRTNFGNVLPNSIRKFEFTWKGEKSFSDIGRYKAELTLAYGLDDRKFSTQTTYFWVIPIKSVLIVLGVALLILALIVLSIRAYVRRVLALSGVSSAYIPPSQRQAERGDVVIGRSTAATAPITSGIQDFKDRLVRVKKYREKCIAVGTFIYNYKKFFVSLVLFIVAGVLLWNYFSNVTTAQRDYEITVTNQDDSSTTLSSEEIIYDNIDADTSVQTNNQVSATQKNDNQSFLLTIINSSDTPGIAARTQKILESDGYTVDDLQSDFEASRPNTVIVYDVSVQDDALALSKKLGGVVLSANTSDTSSTTPRITIRIGNAHSWVE